MIRGMIAILISSEEVEQRMINPFLHMILRPQFLFRFDVYWNQTKKDADLDHRSFAPINPLTEEE